MKPAQKKVDHRTIVNLSDIRRKRDHLIKHPNDYTEAEFADDLNEINELFQNTPDPDPLMWDYKGCILLVLGQYFAAAKCFQHAMVLSPRELKYTRHFARALEKCDPKTANTILYALQDAHQEKYHALSERHNEYHSELEAQVGVLKEQHLDLGMECQRLWEVIDSYEEYVQELKNELDRQEDSQENNQNAMKDIFIRKIKLLNELKKNIQEIESVRAHKIALYSELPGKINERDAMKAVRSNTASLLSELKGRREQETFAEARKTFESKKTALHQELHAKRSVQSPIKPAYSSRSYMNWLTFGLWKDAKPKAPVVSSEAALKPGARA